MTPEEQARRQIDARLEQSGWVIQDMKTSFDPSAAPGVAVREYPTSTGPVDYALFVDGKPVGVVEAKKDSEGQNITGVEAQSGRYAASSLKHVKIDYRIRFVYEATGKLTHFTDFNDINYRSREVFSFHRPETLSLLISQSEKWLKDGLPTTIRNHMKRFPPLDMTGFRDCQITAIHNLDNSFADNKPRALVQMATGAGKTFTAITAAYRLLKYGRMKRILFLVDTKSLGEQAEREFRRYQPNDDSQQFPEIYGVYRLKSSTIPDVQIYISTIQRMYSILKGEELDESTEETSLFENAAADQQPVKQVVYNAKVPPEFFDCIIVDECHRSIYNVWSQVLEYFDAFLIGLTATPDTRTFAYFKNIVSEYTREQAITDGVNVGEDVFVIETEVGKSGGHVMKQMAEYRHRLTHEKRWKMMDEDVNYSSSQLDRSVVNKTQILAVIQCFKDNLPQIFPGRSIVPKTLIFAKNDSHAEDIVEIVREVFGQGNEFCKKITCKADKPEDLIREFANDYNPRIAVTVDMIATGTDVKPLECLIFMRDVRSRNYFEQMKGRGTRVLSREELRAVTSDAPGKDHFIIVDAVGVTKSKKVETRALECKPGVSMKDLMLNVATGSRDAETLTSLASRLARLNLKLSPAERKDFAATVGADPGTLAKSLLDAFDGDIQAERAGVTLGGEHEPTEEERQRMDAAEKELADAAARPICKHWAYIEEVRHRHDQLIDNVNLDRVTFAGFDADQQISAERVIATFREFIEENRDEILALRIIYDQRYADRPMAIEQLKRLYEKLKARGVTYERLWDCYTIKQPEKVKRGTAAQLADLVSLVRFELGYADKLEPFAERVNYNFMRWTLRRNAGPVHFTDEQMEWLYLIRDHIASSLSIEAGDLDLNPFDRKGGLGRFYEVFGERYEEILKEMNAELVA